MKEKTIKAHRIIWTTLFALSTSVILYESVCPANMSVITPVSNLITDVIHTIFPPKLIPLESIKFTTEADEIKPYEDLHLDFDIYPKTATNSEVKFENLTPDYVVLDPSGIIRGCNNSNEIQPQDALAKIKAYSTSNPEIYDIFEIKVHKTIPDQLSVWTSLHMTSTKPKTYEAYVNEDMMISSDAYINGELTPSYQVTSPLIIDIDENYLTKLSSAKYYPIKEGETTVSVYSRDNPDLVEEIKLNIKRREKLPEPVSAKFYDYRIANKRTYVDVNNKVLVSKYSLYFDLVDKNGNQVNVPYIARVSDETISKPSLNMSLDLYKQGKFDLIFELLGDYEGQSITIPIETYHKAYEPTITNDLLNFDNMTIELDKLSSTILNLSYPEDATYTKFVGISSNNEVLKVYNSSNITIEGINSGTAYLTIVPQLYKAEELGLNPMKIKVTVTMPVIKNDGAFQLRFRKSAGHMTGFLLDCVFFELMIYFWFKSNKRFYLLLSAIPIGFAMSGVSELLQMTQPSRGPSFMDVGIDFIGWMIGFVVIFSILMTIILVKKYKEKKDNQDNTDKNMQ